MKTAVAAAVTRRTIISRIGHEMVEKNPRGTKSSALWLVRIPGETQRRREGRRRRRRRRCRRHDLFSFLSSTRRRERERDVKSAGRWRLRARREIPRTFASLSLNLTHPTKWFFWFFYSVVRKVQVLVQYYLCTRVIGHAHTDNWYHTVHVVQVP